METKFSIGALRAAKACEPHVKAATYSYAPEEAAVDIDRILKIPELIDLMKILVEEAKQDLANSPDWSGPTVRISRSRIKELSKLARELSGE